MNAHLQERIEDYGFESHLALRGHKYRFPLKPVRRRITKRDEHGRYHCKSLRHLQDANMFGTKKRSGSGSRKCIGRRGRARTATVPDMKEAVRKSKGLPQEAHSGRKVMPEGAYGIPAHFRRAIALPLAPLAFPANRPRYQLKDVLVSALRMHLSSIQTVGKSITKPSRRIEPRPVRAQSVSPSLLCPADSRAFAERVLRVFGGWHAHSPEGSSRW